MRYQDGHYEKLKGQVLRVMKRHWSLRWEAGTVVDMQNSTVIMENRAEGHTPRIKNWITK